MCQQLCQPLCRQLLVLFALCLPLQAIPAQQESPLAQREAAIALLQGIVTEDPKQQKLIREAIEKIESGINYRDEPLFLDAYRIVPPPRGEKVFSASEHALKKLSAAAKDAGTPENLRILYGEVIARLLESDSGIARLSVETAQYYLAVADGDDRDLTKAMSELDKAASQSDPRKITKALEKAWKYSQEAVGGSEALMIGQFDISPQPYSPTLSTQTMTLQLAMDTGELRASKKSARGEASLRIIGKVLDQSNTVIRTLSEETLIELPRGKSKKKTDESLVLNLSIDWDGRDDSGGAIADGSYRLLLYANAVTDASKSAKKDKGQDKGKDKGKGKGSKGKSGKSSKLAGVTSFPVVSSVVLDGTAPTLTARLEPPANAAGWHNSDVTITFSAADATAGIDSLTPAVVVSEEGVGQLVTGVATDRAGNSGSLAVVVNLDKSPPLISALPDPPPNLNGWHNTDVNVVFEATDALAGLAESPVDVALRTEGAGQLVSGTAVDVAGNRAQLSTTVSIDKTPPTVEAPQAIVLPALDAFGTSADDPQVQAFRLGGSASDNLTTELRVENDTPSRLGLATHVVTFRAVDLAGNEGTNTATITVLDLTPPEVIVPAPIVVGIDRADQVGADVPAIQQFLASATAVDNVDGVVQVGHDAPASFPLGATLVSFTALDAAGNRSTAATTVTVSDETGPVVTISEPRNLDVLHSNPITVKGTIDDATATVVVNGVTASIENGIYTATGVVFEEGEQFVTAVAEDPAGNTSDASISVLFFIPPAVTITEPVNLSALTVEAVTVNGTVDDPGATVTVNGIAAANAGGSFAVQVPLREGANVLTAAATDATGAVGVASVQVTRDTSPPVVHIDWPQDGYVSHEPEVTIAGLINDIVVGTVNSTQASVSVNGLEANVSNRSFLATGVPLSAGSPTVITATGRDQAGNQATDSISVRYEPSPTGASIRLESGNNQTGVVGEQLADPLVVVLRDTGGAPVAGNPVIFRVTGNNGALGDAARRVVAVETDAQGRAQLTWTLGTRAGVGNNVVEASAVGFAGTAIFTATTLTSSPDKINVDSGNSQVGVVGQPLTRPLVAVVTDAGHNRLPDVPVAFSIIEGGGNFGGQTNLVVNSDSDGRAIAVLTLGPEAGYDNNVVEASFAGNSRSAAAFVATGKTAGDPAATVISGVVLDHTDLPIAGVTMQVAGTQSGAVTDEQGQFRIHPAPVGHLHLIVDGTTSDRPGTWPILEFELDSIPGQENTVGMPIYLLPINVPNAMYVDEQIGGVLTLPEVPGLSLTVAPGSAQFPDGTTSGYVSVTVVHADKIPMTPNFGQQPRLAITIQAPGIHFDPPAAITVPNTDGLAPGEATEMYSFDHDLGQFVSIGTGTVSEDGAIIASDPGVGVIKSGWHAAGNPETTGDAEPVAVSIDSGEPILVGLNASRQIVAAGNPAPGTYSWSSAGPLELSGVNSPRPTIRGTELGSGTVSVTYESNGVAETASAQVSVVEVGLATDVNGDGVIDQSDEAGESDLPGKPVILRGGRSEVLLNIDANPAIAGATLVLDSTAEGLTLWSAPEEGEALALPREFVLGTDDIPTRIFAGGDTAGTSSLTLTLYKDGTAISSDALAFNLIKVEFENAAGDDQEYGTSFSNPFPVVTLDEMTASSINIDGYMASMVISGTVSDAIADITPGAGIDTVFVGYTVERDNDIGFDEVPVPVFPATSTISSSGSQGYRGQFSQVVEIPLREGNVEITVRSGPNAVGNVGYDTFVIPVGGQEVLLDEETQEAIRGPVFDLAEPINHSASPEGLVNPIQIFITDSSVTTESQAADIQVEFPAGVLRGVTLEDGRLRVNEVFMGLGQGLNVAAPPNIIDVVSGGASMLKYRNLEREFHWSHSLQTPPEEPVSTIAQSIAASSSATSEDSFGRPADPVFAAGTIVDHYVYHTFRNTHSRKQDVFPYRILNDGREAPELPGAFEILEVERLTGSPTLLGYRIRMRIGNGASGPKQLLMRVRPAPDSEISFPIRVGRFSVEPLKTFIVAVDGFAYQRAQEVTDNQRFFQSRAFRDVFLTSPNRGDDDYVLSQLPTITFTNWSGIFSGLSPRDHGIQGNSFLRRERGLPFATKGKTGGSTSLDHLGVTTRGSLNRRARAKASLYDDVARAAGRTLDVWSVHAFYTQANTSRVNMHDEFYGFHPWYLRHDFVGASALDGATGTDAANRFASHAHELDFLTAYFPGPDNIGHQVGAERVHVLWTPGPPVGEVNEPLISIGERARAFTGTDGQFSKVVDAIRSRGRLNTVMFVLIADHGLHAFHNRDGFNIVLPGKLQTLFSRLGHLVWRDDDPETPFEVYDLVYSANGGMAHVYIRSQRKNWQTPPLIAEVNRVARQLFIEATNGRPNGRQLPRCLNRAEIRTRACIFEDGITDLGSKGKAGDYGAFGDPPAIFVKTGDFLDNYVWVKDVANDPAMVSLGTIDEFLRARTEARLANGDLKYPDFDWPDFKQRLHELNDRNPGGSRSGDILLFTDGRAGYLTVNEGDEFNGWHGGATNSESKVPMMINMGPLVEPGFKNELILDALQKSREQNGGRRLSNYHLNRVLEKIYGELKP